MKRHWLLVLLISACASHPPAGPVLINEKEFHVPTVLADQFEVREAGDAAAKHPAGPLAAPPASPPAVALLTGKLGKKSARHEKGRKKGRKKGQGKGEKRKMEIAAADEVAPLVPNRWTIPPIFHAGDHSVFDITYFGATAGQLELDVLPSKEVAGRLSYHFRATASTSSVFSLFYRLHDVAESFMDTEGLFSHKYSLKLDESKQTRDVLELYDYRKNKAYYWSKLIHADKGEKNDESVIDMVPFTQDGLSAFHFVRTLPLEVGKVFEFPVANNGKMRTVRVTVVRKETLNTKVGEFEAIVVKPEVVLDGVLSSYGDSFMWISDDASRSLLKIDAKIKVGSVIAYLRELSYGDKP